MTRQYLNYNEYRSLGGQLDQTPFNLLEFEARKQIDNYTHRRLINIECLPKEVEMCMYRLINTFNSYSKVNETNKNVSSERIGDYSVDYASGTQIIELIQSKSKEIEDIILTYLTGVIVNGEHIIYCGVC